jgi:hypothetical protein
MMPLRQRFLQDLELAGLAERTCEAYVRAVRQLARHFHQSPDTLSETQVRDYFSHLKNERQFARGSLTIAYSAIKFFFRRTVPRDWKTLEGLRVPPEKKLPDVLTVKEVRRIITATRSEPCRVCLWTIYSLGLRLSEGVSLEVGDLDAARALVHVHRGKGSVDRYVPRSPRSSAPSSATRCAALASSTRSIPRSGARPSSPTPGRSAMATRRSATSLATVFRVAISNARIVSLQAGRVRFRWKKSGSRRWRTMEVDALELLRRFLQHVLPPGLQKVRHYGFLSPQSNISLDDVRALVASHNTAAVRDAIATPSRVLDTSWMTPPNAINEPTCPHCGHRLRLVEILFHRVGFRDSG